MFDHLDFFIAFGEIPPNYIDPWTIDADVPTYVAKFIQDEVVVRNPSSLIDYAQYKSIRSVVQISSDPVPATGNLNGYINITSVPGAQGNIQIIITPGGFAGNETVTFSNGVLTIIIQNNATTRQQLANALMRSNLISNATVSSNPTTPVVIGVGSDSTFLVGGKNQTIYLEDIDFSIGYLNNTSGYLLGSINWIGSRPLDGQSYKISYWAKTLLSVQTDLIQIVGYKKAVSKNYVVEDPNGSIQANDTFWSISNVPTKYLALLFLLDNQDIPAGKVIRQFGLVTNLTLSSGNINDFILPSQILDSGDLMIIDNIPPFRKEPINSEQISIVISI